MTQKSESVREAEQRELEQAREWIAANQPEPLKCMYCGASSPSGSCVVGLGSTHMFSFLSDPDSEAKRLAVYAKSVTLKLAEEAEDAEAEAERHALNLLNFDWSGE